MIFSLSFIAQKKNDVFSIFEEINHWKPAGFSISQFSFIETEEGNVYINFELEKKSTPDPGKIMKKVQEFILDVEKWVSWKLKNIEVKVEKK